MSLPNYCDIMRIDCSTIKNDIKSFEDFSLDTEDSSLNHYLNLAIDQKENFIRNEIDYSHLLIDELKKGCENDNLIFFIAEWNSIICGFAKVEKFDDQGEIFIHSLVTRAIPIKPYIQVKIGQKLIQRIIDDFKEENFSYIKLYPIKSSIGFYEKIGFKNQENVMYFDLK
jgi:N-acetylglutamate synthase-like GNAT family acetyltransferase